MQQSFAQAEYERKKKRTRREVFLDKMEQVVPWARLAEVLAPHYPKAGRRGRPPIGLEACISCSVGVDKREDLQEALAAHGQEVQWHIAKRRKTVETTMDGWQKKLAQAHEKREARVGATVEHPFHVVKNLFRHKKVRYKGLAKNDAQLNVLFALSNLHMMRDQLRP